MVDSKWCPQHGYPKPCDKCGMPLTQQKEIYRAGQRDVVEWVEIVPPGNKLPEGNMKHYIISEEQWQAFKEERGL